MIVGVGEVYHSLFKIKLPKFGGISFNASLCSFFPPMNHSLVYTQPIMSVFNVFTAWRSCSGHRLWPDMCLLVCIP